MDVTHLRDHELLSHIKHLVQSERELLVEILHQLKEIERRRLFADLGYKSLFEYAVRELSYSEGQAIRRIQAMRLAKEIPEIEIKIATGELSLSNVQQAHVFFKEAQTVDPARVIPKAEKLAVLAKLENKSAREAQRELIALQPSAALPKERDQLVTATIAEVRFLMTDALRAKLEELRGLLGPKGAVMSYAELFETMADLSLATTKAKQFGKKRSQETGQLPKNSPPTSAVKPTKNQRYISRALKYEVWKRDHGCCTNCGSRRNLNYDHIRPVGLGGLSTVDNLRLLCFQCNQRAGFKTFGEYAARKSGTCDLTQS